MEPDQFDNTDVVNNVPVEVEDGHEGWAKYMQNLPLLIRFEKQKEASAYHKCNHLFISYINHRARSVWWHVVNNVAMDVEDSHEGWVNCINKRYAMSPCNT